MVNFSPLFKWVYCSDAHKNVYLSLLVNTEKQYMIWKKRRYLHVESDAPYLTTFSISLSLHDPFISKVVLCVYDDNISSE